MGYQGWGAGLGSQRLLATPRPPRPALPASRLAPRLAPPTTPRPAPPTTPRPVPPPRDVTRGCPPERGAGTAVKAEAAAPPPRRTQRL